MNLNEQLQRLGDAEIDDLSIAHDALHEIIELRANLAEMQDAIDAFCTASDWGAETWKRQAHIAALFDLRSKTKPRKP